MSTDGATSLASVTETPISQDDASAEPQEIFIRPRKGWIAIDWAELWHYRELFAEKTIAFYRQGIERWNHRKRSIW